MEDKKRCVTGKSGMCDKETYDSCNDCPNYMTKKEYLDEYGFPLCKCFD